MSLFVKNKKCPLLKKCLLRRWVCLVNEFLEYITLALAQFGGGPGPIQNNLVRFGLAAFFWGILLAAAWSRQPEEKLPREKWLVWGFGAALLREAFMFAHVSWEIITGAEHQAGCFVSEPLEHMLTLFAVVMVSGAFIRYLLPDYAIARRYLQVGLVVTAISYLLTFIWWPLYLAENPGTTFHHTWAAWLFHIAASILLIAAMVLLFQSRGWLRNVVVLALAFLFLGEFLTLINYATDKAYSAWICPVSNSFHILAIPLFGYVYIRELFSERRAAESALKTYRDHLEDLVAARTDDLSRANQHLQAEILERQRAKNALEKLSRHNKMILDAAGEGIFGIDINGNHTFVNPAAAKMLGYRVEELTGQPSHATWHHSRPDGSPYPEAECPLHAGYKSGIRRRGEDQMFWRKNGEIFPVRYVSTPIYEEGNLAGAVIVFQDITGQKQAESQIIRQNSDLATQNAILAAISQSLELDTILDTALDLTLNALQMDVGAVFLFDSAEQTLTLRASRGGDLAVEMIPWGGAEDSPRQKIIRQSVVEMQPVSLDASNNHNASSSFVTVEPMQLLVGTPLIADNKAVGALILGAKRHNAMLPHNTSLLTAIGQQIGIAVENTRLHNRVKHVTMLEERQRIATDMHDGLAQTLSCLGYKIDRISSFVDGNQTNDALLELDSIRNTVDQACTEVRQSIASLQDDPLPRQSLQQWLTEMATKFDPPPRSPIALALQAEPLLFPSDRQLEQVLPVVKESLLNASRHAGAAQITIYLRHRDQNVTITVADDGRGFDPANPPANTDSHFGLQIMRARAARINGRLEIDSEPGKGTNVTLSWHLDAGPEHLPPSLPATASTPEGEI